MKNTKKKLKNIYTEIKTKQSIPHVRRDKFRVQNKVKQRCVMGVGMSAISNADEQMQALSASISVSRY